MTNAFPAISHTYPGLVPWHFGGTEGLTYEESAAYITALTDAERKQRRDAARRRAKQL